LQNSVLHDRSPSSGPWKGVGRRADSWVGKSEEVRRRATIGSGPKTGPEVGMIRLCSHESICLTARDARRVGVPTTACDKLDSYGIEEGHINTAFVILSHRTRKKDTFLILGTLRNKSHDTPNPGSEQGGIYKASIYVHGRRPHCAHIHTRVHTIGSN